MSTIVLRGTKGSALTFAEGDANFSNLNNDKLEDITNESIGDLSNVDLTGIADGQALLWDNANSKFIAGTAGVSSYNDLTDLPTLFDGAYSSLTGTPTVPSSVNDLSDVDTTSVVGGDILVYDMSNSKFIASGQYGGSEITGSVTAIDDVRNPNTLTLDSYAGVQSGDEITFSGTDVTSAGLSAETTYYIWADVGSGAFEISADNSNPVSLTDFGTITDLSWSIATQPTGFTLEMLGNVNVSMPTDGQVLSWADASSEWTTTTITSGIASLSEDTGPTLGGNLDGNGAQVYNLELYDYKETIYDIGSTDSPSIDVQNGNVQTVSITSGLSLPDFTSPETGQSVTLIVTGSGTASGTANYKFAGGATDLTSYSIVSIFYDGTTYWCSINTDFQ